MMIRWALAWALMTVASIAASGDYSAITSSDAALRAAPNVGALQIGVVPAGTTLTATICFYEGAYCHVLGPSIDGYVAGDLLTIAGDTNTVLTAEKARWALMEQNRQRGVFPEWEAENVVVWGDSLSTKALGDELSLLLPGRVVSMQGVPGENGQQITDRMLADTRFDHRLKVIWDRHYPTEKPADYLRDIAPMIEKAKASGNAFLVVSDIRPLLPIDKITDPAVDAPVTASINQQLATLYPDNFVDVTAVLEDPDTRGLDGLHLSALGNSRVAKVLAGEITARSMPRSSP